MATLGEVAACGAAMIELRCRRCDRHGRLSVKRLLAEHGSLWEAQRSHEMDPAPDVSRCRSCRRHRIAVLADELVQVALHRTDMFPRSETPPLFGYLARPAESGPFPAVVVLHSCSGFGPHDVDVAARLKAWRFVALAFDSLGNSNRCEQGGGAYPEAVDASAALNYLSGLSFVRGQRIGVMGYSMGANAVLDAVEAGLSGSFAHTSSERFRAAIAYYPNCRAGSGSLTAPTLILIGDRDDWTQAATFRKLASGESDIGMTREKDKGAPVDLVVYPGATHAFDRPEPSRNYLGHFMEYDTTATRDAEARVQAFHGASGLAECWP